MDILKIVLSIVVFLFSCSDGSQITPERNFYFEIELHQNDAFTAGLAAYLKDNIPKKKYTITNGSGLVWPFYSTLDLDETISPDSLMPPHWFLHRMISRKDGIELSKDDYLVEIHLMPYKDTVGNYRVDVFRMDTTELVFSAGSGVHFVDSTEFSSHSLLLDHYLKSIIRYSFK